MLHNAMLEELSQDYEKNKNSEDYNNQRKLGNIITPGPELKVFKKKQVEEPPI